MSSRHDKGFLPWDRTGNRLLVKSQLGRNKPTNYQIPEENFVYGKLTYVDAQKSNDLMYKWKYHNGSNNKNHLKNKDFIQTNKGALHNLLHTSSQFYQHQKTNTLYKPVKEGNNLIKIKLPQQNHAYGKPLDLQDPIKLVMANTYGEDDQIANHTFYKEKNQAESAPRRKLSCHITKNHSLLKQATGKRMQKLLWGNKKDYWKLSKFSEVGFKVETRRKKTGSIKQ